MARLRRRSCCNRSKSSVSRARPTSHSRSLKLMRRSRRSSPGTPDRGSKNYINYHSRTVPDYESQLPQRTHVICRLTIGRAVRGTRIQISNPSLLSSNRVSSALSRILKIAEQRLAPECRSVQPRMPKLGPQRPRDGTLTAGNVAPFPRCRI